MTGTPVQTAAAAFAGTLVAGAPRSTAGAPARVVIKLGGRALDAPGAAAELAAALRAAPGRAVLVHGGGADVTAWCARLGIEARFDEGLRVTDDATLEVAAAVLAGLANKRLTAALRAAGVDALGLAALDAGIVDVRPHAGAARLGHVGEAVAVDAARLGGWMASGLVPVVASIGAHDGALLNLNADDVAAAVAVALGADVLVLFSDTPGVRVGGAVVPRLAPGDIDAALAGPDVTDGMRVKLRAARDAAAGGVGRVHITAWQGPDTLAGLLGAPGAAGDAGRAARSMSAEVSHG